MNRPEPSDALKLIATAMRERDISQSELARSIGITQSAVQQILSGSTRRSKYLPDIARFLRLDIDALLSATGDRAGGENELDAVQLSEVDIGYGMGGGTFIEDHVDQRQIVFEPTWLAEFTQSPPHLLFVARGIGDSMFPTLLDNDTIIIDRGQQRIVHQDRLWAVTYGELGMIKRVRRMANGRYLLMSDNPQISPLEALEEEIRVVGRVVWSARKH